MASVTKTETTTDQFGLPQTSITQTSYEYDSAGNRVATTNKVDSNGDGTFDTQTRTEYLTESRNHTGYSQVIQETTFDANGNAIKKTVYTVGHDQISQTIYLATGQTNGQADWDSGNTAYFGTDGHGSVRALYQLAQFTDAGGNVEHLVQAMERYVFDAYGNLLGWDNATPLTSYLYSGEAFDFNIGQQYLRARWYDAANGRFNRLDPFAGNMSDPQSLHKYAYVHGDPIQGIDPTGKFFGVAGLLVGITATAALRNYDFNNVVVGGNIAFLFLSLGVAPFIGIAGANAYYNSQTQPITFPAGQRPDHNANSTKQSWKNSLKTHLADLVRSKNGPDADIRAVEIIADKYVELVSDRGKMYHGLQDSSDINFGHGGRYGWLQNLLSGYSHEECKCISWAKALHQELKPIVRGTGWKVVKNDNVTKTSYDPFASLFGLLSHTFVSIEYSPGTAEIADVPDFILDPWNTGRPDIFDGAEFDNVWPISSASARVL